MFIQNIEYEISTKTFKFKFLSLKKFINKFVSLKKFMNKFVPLKNVFIIFLINLFTYATCNV